MKELLYDDEKFNNFMGERTGETWDQIEGSFKEVYTDEEIKTIKNKWLKRYYKNENKEGEA